MVQLQLRPEEAIHQKSGQTVNEATSFHDIKSQSSRFQFQPVTKQSVD